MTATKDTSNLFNPNSPEIKKLLNQINSWKISLFLLTKIPSAFFVGVKVKKVDHLKAEITLPYSWRSQNPFRSTYFAAQAMAAEFSTGILSKIAMHGRGDVSMLVANMEAEFVKKANSLTTFTCEDGALVVNAIQKAIDSGEAQTVTMKSVGVQENGEIVSVMKFTWSFKKRNT